MREDISADVEICPSHCSFLARIVLLMPKESVPAVASSFCVLHITPHDSTVGDVDDSLYVRR